MKSLICGASLAALIVAGLISARVDAADDAPATPEVVMKKLFAGKNAPAKSIQAAVKSGSPDWAKVKEVSDLFGKYVPDLGKNDPPKGDKASWAKLTNALNDEAKKLALATDKKNLEELKASAKAIGGSCKSCHDAHRPE